MINFQNIRFINDSRESVDDFCEIDEDSRKEAERIRLLSQSLKITKELTPELYNRLNSVTQKLNLDIQIDGYVYSSPDMNASCFSCDSNSTVIIIFTSTLINGMSLEELDFVIGHELGHFLFGHLDYGNLFECNSLLSDNNIFQLHQAREISADRIGLLVSNSPAITLRAIIKTVSGLKDDLLTNSIHAYMRQVKKIKTSNISLPPGTHPIFPVRAKAIVLFSMSEYFYKWNKLKAPPITHDELENKIIKELNTTTSKLINDENQHILTSFKEWIYIKHFLSDKHFEKSEQEFFENEFGGEKLKKIKSFISEFGKDGIDKKFNYYYNKFQKLTSKTQKDLICEINDKLGYVPFKLK